MKINSQAYLFFCTSITHINFTGDHPSRIPFSIFDRLEKLADDDLSEFRYWLKGERVNLWTDEVVVEASHRQEYATLALKVQSLALAIIRFISGVLLKAIVWTLDFSYVQRRNRLVFEMLQRQSAFTQHCDPHSHVIPPRQFAEPPCEQNDSHFNQLPPDMQHLVLSFLGDEDRCALAQSCKQNHVLVANFSSDPRNQCQDYPRALVQALGIERLANLPISVLPPEWQILFEKSQEYASRFEGEDAPFHVDDAEMLLFCQTFNSGIEERLSSCMGNDAIQKIQLPEGPALIIQVKDHLCNRKQAFVIAKVREKWMVITRYLSPGMWLFLNEMRLHEDSPFVADYLRRLFNGEPCGSFPIDLRADVEVNFQQERPSSVLQEGPRTCPDGVTPVIQLWPART